jgi:SAM-dependent methyltransferase
MHPNEFTALARVERDHWYYRGKRDIVRHWIERLWPLAPDDLFVDVGPGTGQLLLELSDRCRGVGVEHLAPGLRIASEKPVRLVQGSVLDLPLRSGVASVVTALDVVEHVEDDTRALGELLRVARPGGLAFILVPAFPILWSDWDESLGHKRRYTWASFERLLSSQPARVLHRVYVNSFAFPPILLYRLLRTTLGRRGSRMEDEMPVAPLNRLLHALFVVPACWRWFSPPFGVSIFCILQKDRSP